MKKQKHEKWFKSNFLLNDNAVFPFRMPEAE